MFYPIFIKRGIIVKDLPANFGYNWPCGFREKLKIRNVYGRTTSDGKSSHDIWPAELIKKKYFEIPIFCALVFQKE
jgi:hypothetical protein